MRAAALAVLLALSGCFGGGGGGTGSPPRPPAPAPPPPPVRTLPVLGLGTHSMAAGARTQLRELGVRYVRHTLYAPLWADDAAYRDRFRAQVDSMTADGFHLLLVVHPLPDGWTPEQFAALVGEAAEAMPGVEAWQIGNEDMFGGTPMRHAAYHNAAYNAIKAADPDAKVVSMAWTILLQAQEFAEVSRFDALAVHTYGHPVAEVVRRWEPLARRHVVWITEMGHQPPQLPPGWTGDWEAEQARQIRDAARQVGASGFARAYIYQLRTEEPLERHGIIRPDGTLRPAALWLRAALEERE